MSHGRLMFALLLLILTPTTALAATPMAAQRDGATNLATGERGAQQAAATLEARVVAVNIPGAGAIGPVGRFLPGGPIHDNAAFAAFTQPGKILDPDRLLVGSSSNFGAPLALASEAPGALLSLDPNGDTPIVVPAGFAAGGGQAADLDGRVQLYSAQSPPFLNGVTTPGAATANLPGVSNPHGLSINNGFGRLWPANVPGSFSDPGTESILDPSGVPLANAPNQQTGGVYADALTNRQPQQIWAGDLATAALGTALLGRSPDKSTRAVFAIICADGSIIQAHTGQAIDGLAPAGTITSLVSPATVKARAESEDLRVGVLLNFEPVRILYVSDPLANRVVAITLADDGRVFTGSDMRFIAADSFNEPIGMAPALPETEDADWASNTTLAEGSDLYVANRGDNTIVRLRQDGSVAAVRQLVLPGGRSLGDAHLTSIATSPDGARIWVTVTGALPGFPGQDGAVLEVPAFGAG